MTTWISACRPLALGIFGVLVSLCAASSAADPAPTRTTLPVEHEYQKTLRNYLAGRTEKDYEISVAEKFSQPADSDNLETQYRHWLLSLLGQPLIGSKRGAPAVNAPARLFTLAEIETPAGVKDLPLFPEPAAWVANWDYAGNPYRGSKALKLRTFCTMCVLMTMLDDQIEHAPELGGSRFDSLAPSVLTLAWPYPLIKDAIPEEARTAYETGLRKFGRRLLDTDPRGVQPNMLTVGPVALWHVSQSLGDKAFAAEVEALARRVWTDEALFRPAGYYVDRGGIDLGYAGSANIFTTWAALATDWPFARDAIARTYRLRAYMILPDPDGRLLGPTHFNSRLGSDTVRDQWEWGVYRDHAAALATDEAVHLTTLPTKEDLAQAAGRKAGGFQGQLNENAVNAAGTGFVKNEEIISHPWKFRLWRSWSFPLSVNYGNVYAPADAYAHRLKLETEKSPWLKTPWDREPAFIRSIENEFTMVKQPGYRAIVHSGQVGGDDGYEPAVPNIEFSGFGGGQLSAFWTPSTGSVILGRRGGVSRMKNFDTLESWRQWPIHAVSGTTSTGAVVTSARIRRPEVAIEKDVVRVSSALPEKMLGQETALVGKVNYARSFTLGDSLVEVATSITTDGKETFAELYETIPVFLRESGSQANTTPTKIEFKIADAWTTAGAAWSEQVTAVRLTRFQGAVEVVFDRPRRAKLSPDDWTDEYMSRASCRNVLIDLLENKDQPKAPREAGVKYVVRPAAS